MNGYLVVMRTLFDDIPIFLSSSHTEAIKYAKRAKWDAKKYIWDASEPVNIVIVEFKKGKPVAGDEVVRYFQEEHYEPSANPTVLMMS